MARRQRKASRPRSEADIELSIIYGQLAGGQTPAVVAARSKNPRAVAVLANSLSAKNSKNGKKKKKPKAPEWSEEEDNFLRKNLGWLSDAEMGQALGRTEVAVHLRWKRDLNLTAPSRHPDWVTGEQIAQGLGMDSHAVASWIDRGLLPGRRLPMNDVTRVVYRVTLLRWVVNPENWVHFKPERVGQGPNHRIKRIYDAAFWKKVRRLIKRQRARWKDEWWSTNQVAAYHGVTNKDVVRYLLHGYLQGVRVDNYDGRHPDPHWAYWYVLKSEATRPDLIFYRGPGSGHARHWSDAGDAFMLLARAVGLADPSIARMRTDQPLKRITYRLKDLQHKDQIPLLIKTHRLKIACRPHTGILLADWKVYRHRFKGLAWTMQRFKSRATLNQLDREYIRGVLRAWAVWYAKNPKQRRLIGTLSRHHLLDETLHRAYQTLRAWGADPLRDRLRI